MKRKILLAILALSLACTPTLTACEETLEKVLIGVLTGFEKAPDPTVKEGSFDFSVTYEVDGEVTTISSVYVCEFAESGWGLDGWYIHWNQYVEDSELANRLEQTRGYLLLKTTADGEIYLDLNLSAKYFMRDLKTRAGFVLAGMEGIRYRAGELTLCEGDRLFLYTDGVPEATNTENKLYGENRLLEFMNKNANMEAIKLLPNLKNNIDEFVGDAPQFDDITMLMFDYKPQKGVANMTKKTFPAKTEALLDVLAFVEETLEKHECPMKIQMAICVAIEEVFVNVAHYAYGTGEGDVTLEINFDKETRDITFRMADKGVAFDPLKKPDPDITLSAEEREIGGLGIFITKKTMDLVAYAYENGENILTMRKKI